jgi:hypothetical protein
MTMHLAHPALSALGKKRGKQKFRNADAARQARQLNEDWAQLKQQHGIKDQEKKQRRALSSAVYTPPPLKYRGQEISKIPSMPFSGAVCARPKDKVYTGDKMIGIGTLHKSNSVPVFSSEDAIDIARMRR